MLKSRIWFSYPQREFRNPYSYGEQDLFLGEAESVLSKLLELLQTKNMIFTLADRSIEKAVWMLHIDALDALREATSLLREKRHGVASRLFRDILETMDLAGHFSRNNQQTNRDLAKWYNDEVILHRRSRASLGQAWGPAAEGARRALYHSWSRLTHRSYWAVSQSFGQGQGERIWHDSILSVHGECIPQSVACYLPILGDLIILFILEVGFNSSLKEHEKYREVVACIPPTLLALVGSSYLPLETYNQTPAADC